MPIASRTGHGEAPLRRDKRKRRQAVSEAKEDEGADKAEHGRKKRRKKGASERESQPFMDPNFVDEYANLTKEELEPLIVEPSDIPDRERLVEWYDAYTKIMLWLTRSITKRQWGFEGQGTRCGGSLLHASNRRGPASSGSGRVTRGSWPHRERFDADTNSDLCRVTLRTNPPRIIAADSCQNIGDLNELRMGSFNVTHVTTSMKQPLLDIREFLRRHPNISAAIPETSLLKEAIREAESDQLGADSRPSTPLKASIPQTHEDFFALAQELFTPDIPYRAEPSHVWSALLTQLGNELRASITRSHRNLQLEKGTKGMNGLLRHVTRGLIGIARAAHLAKYFPSLKKHSIFLNLRASIHTVWASLKIWSSAAERLEALLLRHGLAATVRWRQNAAKASESRVNMRNRLQLVEKVTLDGLARIQPLKLILESLDSDEEWKRGPYGIEGPVKLKQLLLYTGDGGRRKKGSEMLKQLLLNTAARPAPRPASSVLPSETHDEPAITEQTKVSVENDERATETTDSTVPLDHGPQSPEGGATLDQEVATTLAPEDQHSTVPLDHGPQSPEGGATLDQEVATALAPEDQHSTVPLDHGPQSPEGGATLDQEVATALAPEDQHSTVPLDHGPQSPEGGATLDQEVATALAPEDQHSTVPLDHGPQSPEGGATLDQEVATALAPEDQHSTVPLDHGPQSPEGGATLDQEVATALAPEDQHSTVPLDHGPQSPEGGATLDQEVATALAPEDQHSTVPLDHGPQSPEGGATLDQEVATALAPEDQRHQMPVLPGAHGDGQLIDEALSKLDSFIHAVFDVTSEMPIPDALPDDASGNADTVMADVQPSDEAGHQMPVLPPARGRGQLIDEALSMLESYGHAVFDVASEMPIPDALPDAASGNADTVMADVHPPDEAGHQMRDLPAALADDQAVDEALSMLESYGLSVFDVASEMPIPDALPDAASGNADTVMADVQPSDEAGHQMRDLPAALADDQAVDEALSMLESYGLSVFDVASEMPIPDALPDDASGNADTVMADVQPSDEAGHQMRDLPAALADDQAVDEALSMLEPYGLSGTVVASRIGSTFVRSAHIPESDRAVPCRDMFRGYSAALLPGTPVARQRFYLLSPSALDVASEMPIPDALPDAASGNAEKVMADVQPSDEAGHQMRDLPAALADDQAVDEALSMLEPYGLSGTVVASRIGSTFVRSAHIPESDRAVPCRDMFRGYSAALLPGTPVARQRFYLLSPSALDVASEMPIPDALPDAASGNAEKVMADVQPSDEAGHQMRDLPAALADDQVIDEALSMLESYGLSALDVASEMPIPDALPDAASGNADKVMADVQPSDEAGHQMRDLPAALADDQAVDEALSMLEPYGLSALLPGTPVARQRFCLLSPSALDVASEMPIPDALPDAASGNADTVMADVQPSDEAGHQMRDLPAALADDQAVDEALSMLEPYGLSALLPGTPVARQRFCLLSPSALDVASEMPIPDALPDAASGNADTVMADVQPSDEAGHQMRDLPAALADDQAVDEALSMLEPYGLSALLPGTPVARQRFCLLSPSALDVASEMPIPDALPDAASGNADTVMADVQPSDEAGHQMRDLPAALADDQAVDEALSMLEPYGLSALLPGTPVARQRFYLLSPSALDVTSEMPIPDALPDAASGNADKVMADVQPSDEAGHQMRDLPAALADDQVIDEALSMLESGDQEAFEAALAAAVNELFYGETDES
ncbi:hypothetical protein TGRH88_072090 [Toxoplasma gondii]|uniref:Uncharacterized protein n=1 Tax=Toxoplasma gondii TaxID=5811 RepID=A0A7J6K3K3_TOXGO|nr:hypothetical protein TGRH88_072090 [Toxoplasma gondii]